MLRHTGIAATLATAIMVTAAAPAAASCARDNERAALDVRVYQSELMVGAITCGRVGDYNSFATRYQTALVSHGQQLRGYFTRVHGSGGERELNRFVTGLANEAASRRVEHGSRYCDLIGAMFEDAQARSPSELGLLAGKHPAAASHGVGSCSQTMSADASTERR